MRAQHTGIVYKILMAIMLVIIVALIYFLAGGRTARIGTSRSVTSPNFIPAQQVATDENSDDEFSDGLGQPDTVSRNAPDEFGAGVVSVETFNRDINDDGRPDRITRTRVENGTPHFYYEYKIEINERNGFRDITPAGFRTTEGESCALQKLQFSFRPDFHVTKVSRKWVDSWDTPTPAEKTVYGIYDGNLEITETSQLKSICNVAELL